MDRSANDDGVTVRFRLTKPRPSAVVHLQLPPRSTLSCRWRITCAREFCDHTQQGFQHHLGPHPYLASPPPNRPPSCRQRVYDDPNEPAALGMASRRSLGGGRVLGNGKNLAPPVPTRSGKQPVQQSGLLSPSESSISLSSHASSTPVSAETEDLTSRVALDEHGSSQAAAAASSRMVCPICNEEMVCPA